MFAHRRKGQSPEGHLLGAARWAAVYFAIGCGVLGCEPEALPPPPPPTKFESTPTPGLPAPDASASAPAASPGGSQELDEGRSTPMFEGRGAPLAIAMIRRRIGSPIRALDVSIFPDSLAIQLQHPGDRKRVLRYEVQDGEVTGPTPVNISGEGSLELALFTVDDEAFPDVGAMIAATREHYSAEQGRVNFISVDRDLPFSAVITYRVFVAGKDFNAYADFDGKGKLVRHAVGVPK